MRIYLFATVGCAPKLDIVFVFDVSVSIGDEDNFKLMKNFAMNSLQSVTIGLDDSLVSVVLFASHAWINFTLTEHTDKPNLYRAIDQIKYDEISKHNRTGTNTPEALSLLKIAAKNGRLGLRDDTVKIVIFITDGRPNTNHLNKTRGQALNDTIEAANKLHSLKIYKQFFAIGIMGKRTLMDDTLHAIAGPSSKTYHIKEFDKQEFNELATILSTSFHSCK